MTASTSADAALSSALHQAVAWAVRLASGTASATDHAACAAWRQQHPEHESAWQQVQAVEAQFVLPTGQGRLAHGALQAASEANGPRARGRRQALRRLAGGAGLGMLGWLGWRWQPQAPLELATAVGKRLHTTLADGSALHLAPRTRVQVRLGLLRRVVQLGAGEVLITTGADDRMPMRRPFWVETPLARFEAIGTRFGVQHAPGQSRLYVTEGRVAIHAAFAPGPVVVQAGEAFIVRAGQPLPQRLADDGSSPGAWAEGALVARRMRLDALVAELARYRATPLVCAPEVAALRVSGVFQLDGPDPVGRALDVLIHTLPVRVVDGGEGPQRITGL